MNISAFEGLGYGSISVSQTTRFIVGSDGERVFGFSSTGEELWTSKVTGVPKRSALSSNGVLYLRTFPGHAVGIPQDGADIWTMGPLSTVMRGPLIAPSGNAVFSDGNRVLVLGAQGTILFEHLVDVDWVSALAIAADGDIFLAGPTANGTSTMIRISTNGEQLSTTVVGHIHSTAVVLVGDIVVVSGSDGSSGRLIGFGYPESDAVEKWDVELPWYGTSAPGMPSASLDGHLFVGDGDGNVNSYEAESGKLVWSSPVSPGLPLEQSTSIDEIGTVLVATQTDLVALSPEGVQLWEVTVGEDLGSPVVGGDGFVYIEAQSPDVLSSVRAVCRVADISGQ